MVLPGWKSSAVIGSANHSGSFISGKEFVHLKLEPSLLLFMAQYPCENCKLRAHYDKNPKSVLGRLWRWHINFCPGFKAYFTHQDAETQNTLREKYDFKKYQ